jgi:hypothetical protein
MAAFLLGCFDTAERREQNFLLQANPVSAAAAITSFVNALS